MVDEEEEKREARAEEEAEAEGTAGDDESAPGRFEEDNGRVAGNAER